jgi:hypothetical protein
MIASSEYQNEIIFETFLHVFDLCLIGFKKTLLMNMLFK